jgi:UDP-N-acetylglucosamine 2-epimerase (non-hydrolysing)
MKTMTTSNSERPLRLLCIVGARPNFMKIAPLMRVFRAAPADFDVRLVHTGQHYDQAMKESFFIQLQIPEPDIDLGVGSGSHAVQTAEIMRRFEPVVDDFDPDAVLVVGDVNSTIACALVAAKKQVAVIHVEAGLRSGDRAMPEEVNRVLTDQLSDLLFTTEPDGEANLLREGVAGDRIHFVGNVMIDTLLANRERAVPASDTLAAALGSAVDNYGLVTMHRPSNVDNAEVLRGLLGVLAELSAELPLVFPIHPRTRARIAEFGFDGLLSSANIALTDPLGYLELLGLMADARVVLTDSGGLQEETTALGVPCITMRENTERPITVDNGTNTIVGTDTARIRQVFDEIMQTGGKAGRVPELWDGRAAERIAAILRDWHQGAARPA